MRSGYLSYQFHNKFALAETYVSAYKAVMNMNGPDITAKTSRAYGRLSLAFALFLMIVFSANVLGGKLYNNVFMSDVTEAITLFSAAIFFVIGVLRLEKATKICEEISKERELSGEQEGTNRA